MHTTSMCVWHNNKNNDNNHCYYKVMQIRPAIKESSLGIQLICIMQHYANVDRASEQTIESTNDAGRVAYANAHVHESTSL